MASYAENVSIWWRHHDHDLILSRARVRPLYLVNNVPTVNPFPVTISHDNIARVCTPVLKCQQSSLPEQGQWSCSKHSLAARNFKIKHFYLAQRNQLVLSYFDSLDQNIYIWKSGAHAGTHAQICKFYWQFTCGNIICATWMNNTLSGPTQVCGRRSQSASRYYNHSANERAASQLVATWGSLYIGEHMVWLPQKKQTRSNTRTGRAKYTSYTHWLRDIFTNTRYDGCWGWTWGEGSSAIYTCTSSTWPQQ